MSGKRNMKTNLDFIIDNKGNRLVGFYRKPEDADLSTLTNWLNDANAYYCIYRINRGEF